MCIRDSTMAASFNKINVRLYAADLERIWNAKRGAFWEV